MNTIFLATFTYGRGIGGRQPRGSALPDHGKQEYDDNFHGGNFATPHPQYYRNTSIAPEKAPDHPNYDVIADVLPAAKKRGMKVICWFEDVIGANVPGFDQAREVTLTGRPSTFACSRNPNTRNFWLGMVEDYLRSYDVDGLMWGSERQGPLGNAIVANHGGVGAGGGIACFCQYCSAEAKKRGIDVDRAREGYLQLAAFVNAGRDGRRPADGSFVTFWRLLTRITPRSWNGSVSGTTRSRTRIATCTNSPSPSRRRRGWAGTSGTTTRSRRSTAPSKTMRRSRKYSDFLKVVIYNLCGGERLAQYVRSVQRSLFADLTPEQVLELTYGVHAVPRRPARPARGDRPVAGVRAARDPSRRGQAGPTMKIWPGIDIDIPTAATSKKTTPDDVYRAVKAAFDGGAHGVLLSRKYSEMRLANLGGAGRAIREARRA